MELGAVQYSVAACGPWMSTACGFSPATEMSTAVDAPDAGTLVSVAAPASASTTAACGTSRSGEELVSDRTRHPDPSGGGMLGFALQILITQRSQVQILPPLQVKLQVRGPFSLRGGRASGVDVRRMYAPSAAGQGRTGPDSGVRWTRSRRQSDPRRCGNRSRNPDGCLESRRHRHVRREGTPMCQAALASSSFAHPSLLSRSPNRQRRLKRVGVRWRRARQPGSVA